VCARCGGRKLARRIVNARRRERQRRTVSLDPAHGRAPLLADSQHRLEAVDSDETRDGQALVISRELLSSPAPDVDEADVRFDGRVSLLKKGQQVRIEGVVPTWLVVEMGDFVVIDPGHR